MGSAYTAACLPLPSWVRSPVRAFCGVPDKLTLLPHKVPSRLSSTAGGLSPRPLNLKSEGAAVSPTKLG